MEKKLLDAEWTILRAMWGKPPQTMREIIDSVQSEDGDVTWHYKTYHSYLRSMLNKGLIACEHKNLRDKLYRPLVTREEALKTESETLLSRISTASMGALMAAMAQSAPLSDGDKRALMDMAMRLEKDGEQP